MKAGRRELAEELQYHLDRQIEQNVAAGMTPGEAHRATRRALGALTQNQEACRDQRALGWIEDLARDLRYGARGLRRDRGFGAAALLMLALGIGATTAMFSLVYGILLRPLPYAGADRVVVVNMTYGAPFVAHAVPEFRQPRALRPLLDAHVPLLGNLRHALLALARPDADAWAVAASPFPPAPGERVSFSVAGGVIFAVALRRIHCGPKLKLAVASRIAARGRRDRRHPDTYPDARHTRRGRVRRGFSSPGSPSVRHNAWIYDCLMRWCAPGARRKR